MKKLVLLAAMLFASLPFAYSQDTTQAVRFYGFIRNYYTFDMRKTYSVVGGEYNLIPYDRDTVDGVDLNAVPQGQLQALSSRFGVDVAGPMLGSWKSSGKLEGDFGGFGSNNTVLRLRLAYVKLTRTSPTSLTSSLLIGQDWHPLSGNIMPEVLGMAAGAPFRPHSRTPQVRGQFSILNSQFSITAALLWQLQYMNNGPASATNPASTASTHFAHQALWPEAFLGLNYKQGPWYLQLGADAQQLRPRTHALIGGVTRKVDETVSSLSPTLYAQYVQGRWSVKFRTLLAENTSHLNQLCGYAVAGVNPDGSWRYAPIRNSISYLNIAYTQTIKHSSTQTLNQSGNQTIRYNLFLGYMKNLGAGESLYDFGGGDYLIYLKGGENFTHLNSFYRVSPSLNYNVKAFNLGLEYELTVCTYGNIATDGSIRLDDNLHHVANHRLCLLVKYNF